MNEKVSLSSPLYIYFRQIHSLFKKDPDVEIALDDDIPELNIYVEDAEKADALTKLLPKKKKFGNIVLNISVISKERTSENLIDIFKKAFKGNEAVINIDKTVHSEIQQYYIIFKKEIVQYFNDVNDPHSICSTLYQDLAKEVFVDLGDTVHFCTEYQNNVFINREFS